jgi:hypothetical protein
LNLLHPFLWLQYLQRVVAVYYFPLNVGPSWLVVSQQLLIILDGVIWNNFQWYWKNKRNKLMS